MVYLKLGYRAKNPEETSYTFVCPGTALGQWLKTVTGPRITLVSHQVACLSTTMTLEKPSPNPTY